MKTKKCAVIIAAAGHGTRMGMAMDKQYLEIDGVPILAHTTRVFEKCASVSEIILGTGTNHIDRVNALIKTYGFTKSKVSVGGDSRQETIYNALKMVDADTDVVLVHDGVRPFIKESDVMAVIETAIAKKTAVLAVPAKDTIKCVADDSNQTVSTLDRSKLWLAHTPQGFDYHLLLAANKRAVADGFIGTDDSSLVERLGEPIHFVTGHYSNIKITTPEDLAYGQFLMQWFMSDTPASSTLSATNTGVEISPVTETTTGGVVTIYTDGACSGNPGPGGYGAVLLYNGKRKEISKGFANTTNNRMELTAIIDALALLKNKTAVELYSDSKYVVDAINLKWVYKWQSNAWKRNKSEMAQNVDLWEQLLPLLEKHDVVFKWVKGHANNVENERCDELARAATAGVR